MKTLDYSLLKQVQAMTKQAFAPPPEEAIGGSPGGPSEGSIGGEPPMDAPDAMGGGAAAGEMPTSPEELIELISSGLAEGASEEEIRNVLAQSGIPEDIINEAMAMAMEQVGGAPPAEGGAPTGGPPPPTENVEDIAHEEAMKEVQTESMPPDQRLQMLEKKVEVMTQMMQEIVDSMAPKQASDRTYYDAILTALEYE